MGCVQEKPRDPRDQMRGMSVDPTITVMNGEQSPEMKKACIEVLAAALQGSKQSEGGAAAEEKEEKGGLLGKMAGMAEQAMEQVAQAVGMDKGAPESGLKWVLGEDCKDPADIKAFYDYQAKYLVEFHLKFGYLFCTRDKESKEINGVLCVMPPGSVKQGVAETPFRLAQAAAAAGVPPFKDEKKYGASLKDRMKAQKICLVKGHQKTAPGEHFAITMMGIKPDCQKNKIGTTLLNFFVELCDNNNGLGYAEVCGDELKQILEKQGFEIKHQEKELKDDKQPGNKLDKVVYFLLRPQKNPEEKK